MFTGIIIALGKVLDKDARMSDVRFHIAIPAHLRAELTLGDSVAMSGVCLTVCEISAQGIWVDVSNETLRCTNLGEWDIGHTINLEASVRLQDRMGGHMVSGHVDGVGKVIKLTSDARSTEVWIQFPKDLAHLIAAKGSICVDGTSLTVNQVTDTAFSVNIIPHTWDHTIFSTYQVGSSVNLEVDVIARYLDRMISVRSSMDLVC